MSPRILVIDDDHDALLLLKLTLQPYGYQIIDANRIIHGLNIARQENPDLIVLEVAIEGGAGFDLCRRLRLLPGGRARPILILSRLRRPEEVIRGLEAGANGYMTKPANPAELVARVQALLGSDRSFRPVVVLVLGGKGGVGATTIAVNLGITLARRWPEQVVLIDAEIPGGDPAVHLNLHPGHTLADLISYGHTVDTELVEGVISKHSSGLQLISAPTEELEHSPAPDYLTPILHAMAGHQKCVIIDSPPVFGEQLKALAQLATHILVIATPELPALLRARALLDSIPRGDAEEGPQLHLVLNQADRAGGVPVDSFPDGLEVYPLVQIPHDPQGALASINAGEPIVSRAPHSTMARKIVQLAQSLCLFNEEEGVQPWPGSRIKAVLNRLGLPRAGTN